MTETVKPTIETLSVTADQETLDRDIFLAERALCTSIVEKGDGKYEVDTKFPVIIGEVPESERQQYSNLQIERHELQDLAFKDQPFYEASDFTFNEFAALLPETAAIIARDFELLGIKPDLSDTSGPRRGFRASATVLRQKREAVSPDTRDWHQDGVEAGRGPDFDMFYLISDVSPTLLYEGPVKMQVTSYGAGAIKRIEMEHNEEVENWQRPDFNGKGKVAVAPTFAIMRMNAMSVHSHPAPQTEVTRVVTRLWVSPGVVPSAVPLTQ